ncbi:MAG: glycosyltransferase [Cyanobacteria bacterium]|nr:glycosyltransferase [Cyanobacteriota bacterium]
MKKNNPLISVIIPVKEWNNYLEENVKHLLKSSYQNFETLVLIDNEYKISFSKTKIIPTGNIGPAEKRDLGAKMAKGEILAFIDDDAYPSKDWLKNSLPFLKKEDVAAVCGPGVTPPNDSIFQKISGAVNASLIGGGPYTYRFIPQKERFVDDYPSMNIIIKKTDFWKIGGFDNSYWPGEDTKLCLDIVEKLKKKILYHPGILVYHHRRPIFKKHLQQNGRYGLHRGYFAKVLPLTSLRPSYFMPSCLLFSIIFAPVFLLVSNRLFLLDFSLILLYLLLVIMSAVPVFIREKDFRIAALFIPGVITTHLFYGIKFIQGFFFTKKLIR